MVTSEYEISGHVRAVPRQGDVLEPRVVVALGEVEAELRPAGLLALQRAHHDALGHVEHVPELDGAQHVLVEDVPRSSTAATLASSLSRRMISCASVRPASSRNTAHFSFIIVPSSSLISEIAAAARLAAQDLVDHPPARPGQGGARGGGHRPCRRRAARRARPSGGRRSACRAASSHRGGCHRGRRRTPPRPRRTGRGSPRRAPHVGLDAAHDVVAAGLDVDRLAGDVDAREVAPDVDDLAQRLERALARHLGDVQRDGAVGEAAALVDLASAPSARRRRARRAPSCWARTSP